LGTLLLILLTVGGAALVRRFRNRNRDIEFRDRVQRQITRGAIRVYRHG